jgi:hypothetical protein
VALQVQSMDNGHLRIAEDASHPEIAMARATRYEGLFGFWAYPECLGPGPNDLRRFARQLKRCVQSR